MRPELVPFVFMGVWFALLVLVGLFYWKGSLATKRRYHPYVQGGVALIFLAFITLVMPASTFVVIVPFVALITFANYKLTVFCDSCGATTFQRPGMRRKTCRKCGEPLA